MYQSLAHSRWDCKYHIVFIPKRRKKSLFVEIRKQMGEIFHELARQKACKQTTAMSGGTLISLTAHI